LCAPARGHASGPSAGASASTAAPTLRAVAADVFLTAVPAVSTAAFAGLKPAPAIVSGAENISSNDANASAGNVANIAAGFCHAGGSFDAQSAMPCTILS